jgi:fluoride exporter
MNLQARDLAMVAAGGAIGSTLRYLVGKAMGPQADSVVPWHTLLVNVTGAFMLGLLIAVAARHGWPGWWRPFIAVGILGGYTTFSTYSIESVELMLRGQATTGAAYALGSLGIGLLAAWLGLLAGRSA